MAIEWKKIAFVENSAAQSILGNPTGSPAVATAITVAEQTLVGRITGGNVDDLSVEQVKAMLGITVSGSSIAVHQVSHGFAVGDLVYLDSTTYKKADCTTEAKAEVAGMVTVVAGNDDFTLTTSGWTDGLTGLTAGAVYFLSATAGAMTVTAPTTEGYVDKPVFLADTTTSGFVLQMRGVVITASAVSDTAFGTSWNGETETAPSKNAVYDKIEALPTPLSGYKDLVIAYASASTVAIAAASLILEDSSNKPKRFESLLETLNIANSGANGLDTGSEAANTWYYIWAIGKEDGTLDGLLSTSYSSPTLPSGYTYKLFLGAIRNDGSSNFIALYQKNNMVVSVSAAILSGGTQTSYTEITITDVVPYRTVAITGTVNAYDADSTANGYLAADSAGSGELLISSNITGRQEYTLTLRGMFTDAPTMYYKTVSGDAIYASISGWQY